MKTCMLVSWFFDVGHVHSTASRVKTKFIKEMWTLVAIQSKKVNALSSYIYKCNLVDTPNSFLIPNAQFIHATDDIQNGFRSAGFHFSK